VPHALTSIPPTSGFKSLELLGQRCHVLYDRFHPPGVAQNQVSAEMGDRRSVPRSVFQCDAAGRVNALPDYRGGRSTLAYQGGAARQTFRSQQFGLGVRPAYNGSPDERPPSACPARAQTVCRRSPDLAAVAAPSGLVMRLTPNSAVGASSDGQREVGWRAGLARGTTGSARSADKAILLY